MSGILHFATSSRQLALAMLFSLAMGQATAPHTGPQEGLARFVKIRSWGCTDCQGPEQFGSIQGLDVDAEGGAYIVDRFEPFIRVWSSSGDLVTYFGLEGEGPGEFGFPSAILSRDGGEFSVVDMRLRRWTIFDSGGRVTATKTIGGSITAAAHAPAERALYTAARRAWTGGCRGAEIRRWVLDEPDPTFVTALDTPRYGYEEEEVDCPAAVVNFAVKPDGNFLIAFGFDQYIVREVTATGSIVWEVTREVERVPRTQREIDVLTRRFTRPGVTPITADVDPLRNHFNGGSLRYDAARSRIWVRSERGYGELTIFDIFSENGQYLGEVKLPVKVKSPGDGFALAGDYLLAVYEAGPLETEFVGLWRVEWLVR